MSLEKKDLRLKLTPETHEKLRMLASVAGIDLSVHGEHLLEKMVIGEFHVLSVQIDRMEKSGILGHGRD